MSAPVPNTSRPALPNTGAQPGRTGPFGQPTETDKRTTALQGAITILRNKPQVKADEVLRMAEEFHAFLKKP